MEQQKEEKKATWIEASQLPEGEKVYLKKDFLGWRTVEPWKNDDGSLNWFVICTGGKRNLMMLILILIIATMLWFAVHQLIAGYEEVAKEPCKFCLTCFNNNLDPLTQLNLSDIRL